MKKLSLIFIIILLLTCIYIPVIKAETTICILGTNTQDIFESSSREGRVIGKAKPNTEYELLYTMKNWVKIRFDGNKEGWILSEIAKLAKTGQVKIEYSVDPAVKSYPSAGASNIGKAIHNESYDLIDISDVWYKIRLKNGKEGWILGTTAELIDSSQEKNQKNTSNSSSVSSGSVRIKEGSNPNIRSKPSTDGSIIGNAKSNQVYELWWNRCG